MADQKNRGGQKQGNQQPEQPEGQQHDGRSDNDKRADQMSNPDDSRRQPTDQQR